MAVVPDPGVPAGFGPEVGLAVVVDLRGETQQAAVGGGGRLAGGGGQALLLVGALQHEHGPVLHVGGLLHHLGVEHQVRSRWGPEQSRAGEAGGARGGGGAVVLLSEQDTPAAWPPPPRGQFRCTPWCRQWDSDISVPEQRTPLITTVSAPTWPGQYQVSWGAGQKR